MSTNFNFISDDVLRRMIERDKKEMDKCLQGEMSKSVLILAGSIIEAIMVDYFLAFLPPEKTENQILKASLADLIDWAEQENLITTRIKDISTVVRGYRNLIHPGKEYRLHESFDLRSATVAANLLEMIIDEISKNYADRLGYSMEQAIRKVKIDPACLPILPHMVENMSLVERIKLFRIIPSECEQVDTDSMTNNFIILHDLLSKNIPEHVVKEETIKVYEYTQTKAKEEVLFYLRFFYDQLDKLSEEQMDAVISYTLGVLTNANERDIEIINNWKMSSLGTYFNKERYKDAFKKAVISSPYKVNEEYHEQFLDILESIFIYIDGDLENAIKETFRRQTYSKTGMLWAKRMDTFLPF